MIPNPPELKKRLEKAREKGDTAEESKLCNAIGEKHFQTGRWVGKGVCLEEKVRGHFMGLGGHPSR